MAHRIFALALLIFVQACTPKTKPAEVFPGFEVAGDSMATIRESDQVYIQSIDGKKAKRGGSILGRDLAYRQYQVPAGEHEMVVFYDSGETDAAGPGLTIRAGRPGSLGLPDITMPVTLQAGHTYSFTSGVSKFHLKFNSSSSTAKWNPTVIDDGAKQPAEAATQPTAGANR